MPLREINRERLLVEESGSGDPLVLVHGSWNHRQEVQLEPVTGGPGRTAAVDSHASRYAEEGQVHQPSGGGYGIPAGRARTSCWDVGTRERRVVGGRAGGKCGLAEVHPLR